MSNAKKSKDNEEPVDEVAITETQPQWALREFFYDASDDPAVVVDQDVLDDVHIADTDPPAELSPVTGEPVKKDTP